MKKLIKIIIFTVAVLVSGCDTTETTMIYISLGGDHRGAIPPPTDISVVYIAAYTIEHFSEWDEIDTLAGAYAVFPVGFVSIVVPANRDIFILLAAQSTENNWFYLGEGQYPVPGNPGSNTVTVTPEQTSIDGLTSLNISAISDSIILIGHDEGNWSLSNLMRGVFDLHIDGKPDGGDYQRLETVNYYELYNESGGGYLHTYPGGSILDDTFRSRIYLPAFGIYLHTWGEGGIAMPVK